MDEKFSEVWELLALAKTAKKKLNLPCSQELFILLEIKHNKEMTASAVAERYNVTIPAVTHKLDSLIENGYIEKKVCDKDKRVKHYILTEKADKYLSVIKKEINEKITYLFDFIGEDDKEELFRILRKISEMEMV